MILTHIGGSFNLFRKKNLVPTNSIDEIIKRVREQYEEGSTCHKRVVFEHLVTVPDKEILRIHAVADVLQDRRRAIYLSLRWWRRPLDREDDVETVDEQKTTEEDAMNLVITAMQLAQPMLRSILMLWILSMIKTLWLRPTWSLLLL